VAGAILKEAPGAALDFDRPMREMTYLRIGGAADLLVTPSSSEEAAGVVRALGALGENILVIGGGTNLLVRDAGIRGAVIRMSSLTHLLHVDDKGGEVLLSVGAGLPLNKLLGHARVEGLSGIEGLAGIPGYVGGAIAGNAGSFGSEMMDVVREISLIGPDGKAYSLRAGEFTPGYRSSGLPEGSVITGALLVLGREEPSAVAARMDEALSRKKETQPLGQRSAGCVFKNPPGDSAGRLIDAAGCKGMREGSVEVSSIHAGFFINANGGTAGDFMKLMERVSARVLDVFGTSLESEIKVVGVDA